MPNGMVDVIALEPADLPRWEPAWRALESRVPAAAPFLCFDWLAAWAEAYAPPRLAVVRVGDSALGLLELGAGGRWRFAGRPIGAERALLCAPADRAAVWGGLAGWLRAHARRWATLEVQCMPTEQARALPGVSQAAAEVPVLALPSSFEEYLEDRGRSSRRRFQRILRRIERDGAKVRAVSDADVQMAIGDFVTLHERRAASKGERHPAVDRRLARVLCALRGGSSVELRLFELVQGGRRLGVSIRIDRPGGSWFYNGGFDPAASALAPGIALELTSIRDAIERGHRRHDLGPGAQAYKLELGGTVETRADVQACSPSMRGRVLGAAAASSRRARERMPVRTILRRARSRLARS